MTTQVHQSSLESDKKGNVNNGAKFSQGLATLEALFQAIDRETDKTKKIEALRLFADKMPKSLELFGDLRDSAARCRDANQLNRLCDVATHLAEKACAAGHPCLVLAQFSHQLAQCGSQAQITQCGKPMAIDYLALERLIENQRGSRNSKPCNKCIPGKAFYYPCSQSWQDPPEHNTAHR